ncbi:MAG: hypothetical protein CMJ21_01735 [Phycisphaerae bacterium]|nr:hypothetical protein [Phycisphaerae bacterium]
MVKDKISRPNSPSRKYLSAIHIQLLLGPTHRVAVPCNSQSASQITPVDTEPDALERTRVTTETDAPE